MRSVLVLWTITVSLRAAGIRGVVLEHATSRPVARSIVRLDPVPSPGSSRLRPQTTRAGRSGQFMFASVEPGMYLLVAVSEGYFPASYGQRLPMGRGTPIELAADSELFAELRLRHKGAITGRVLDENGVARGGVSVLAYRARLPLRSAGTAKSDDRGVYRIAGLEPGKYWVRSAAHTWDDGTGWLPTFGPQGREIRDARVHVVSVDADTTDADVSPETGRLFRLSGLIQCDTSGLANVVVSSETGRRTTTVPCNSSYQLEGLAPAVYEVFAVRQDGTASGFNELFLDRDSTSGGLQLMPPPAVDFEMQKGSGYTAADASLRLTGRRRDMSESEAEHDVTVPRTALEPGHWELRAHPTRGQYVVSIGSPFGPRRLQNPVRPSDWFEVFIQPRSASRIRVSLSDQAGQIAGKVLSSSKPVPGVTVFLWPVTEAARRSLGGPLQLLSDTGGNYRFESLPPGDYRLLASFDVNEIDEELMQPENSTAVRLEGMQIVNADLPVWIAP